MTRILVFPLYHGYSRLQMKLKPPLVKKLSTAIFVELQNKKLLQILSSPEKVVSKIESVIMADVNAELEIEQTARKVMEQYRAQVESGAIDYQKMYSLIKKQLIKERKFTP